MDLKLFATVFGSIFLAEIGDKTQLATLLFASDAKVSKWTVFAASALALCVCAGLGVVFGEAIGRHVSPKTLRWVAGVGFVAIGVWTIARG